jgi:hypothetical protein
MVTFELYLSEKQNMWLYLQLECDERLVINFGLTKPHV